MERYTRTPCSQSAELGDHDPAGSTDYCVQKIWPKLAGKSEQRWGLRRSRSALTPRRPDCSPPATSREVRWLDEAAKFSLHESRECDRRAVLEIGADDLHADR